MYTEWKNDNPDIPKKPGFSTFASLRPKECVLAGGPGTHTICVCSVHQNVKLRIKVISNTITYKDLIPKCVCSITNKNCMMHNSEECPKEKWLLEYLETNNMIPIEDNVKFHTWISVANAEKEVQIENVKSNRISLL